MNQQKGLKCQVQLKGPQGAMPDIIRCIWQAAIRNSRNPCIDNRETEGFHGVFGED